MRQVDSTQGGSPGPYDATEVSALVLDTIPAAYLRLDAHLRFTLVNRAAEPPLGSTRNELIGKTPWEAQPACAGTALEDCLRRAKQQNTAVSFENYFEPWNRWYAITAIPDSTGGTGGPVFRHHR